MGPRETGEVSAETLEALQSEISFQADTIQALNQAIATQQRDILDLRRQLELLAGRIRELERGQGPAEDQSEPPPPHY